MWWYCRGGIDSLYTAHSRRRRPLADRHRRRRPCKRACSVFYIYKYGVHLLSRPLPQPKRWTGRVERGTSREGYSRANEGEKGRHQDEKGRTVCIYVCGDGGRRLRRALSPRMSSIRISVRLSSAVTPMRARLMHSSPLPRSPHHHQVRLQ